MSFSSGLNPNVVKTALDDVFEAAFNGEEHPNNATAMSPTIFNQSTIDRQAVILEQFKGVGLWEERAEEEEVPQGNPRVDNTKTFNVVNFAKAVDITKNMFDDDTQDSVNAVIRDFGDTARVTRDDNAMALWRNAFTTTLTADGAALISDTHTNLNGDTIDNKLTAALSVTSLEDSLILLREQIAQDGTIRGHVGATLLVPTALYREAAEITESELISDSADNALNWSARFGIQLMTSPHLGVAAGGSDTAWFILARNFSVFRWVRQAVETVLVDWKLQRNNNYIYKGEFREVVGAMSYEGTVGSDGTT